VSASGKARSGDAMRRLSVGLALMLAVLAMPAAHAQKSKAPQPPSPAELEKKREAEALDRQYKSTLKRTDSNAAPVQTDPWSNMRGPDSGQR
jgi:hypothetical protein